jgi:CBS-domain-containing membrane protein
MMLCREIMRRHVHRTRSTETVQSVARRMRDANVGIMPVCEPNGRVIGVVTDRDLALRTCAEDLRASTITMAEVMTPDVIACGPDDPVGRAMGRMRTYRITRVFVLDEERCLLGLISLSDLAFYEPTARMGRTLRAVAERKYEPERGP